ncbi:hypothetical protein, partial [Rhodoferax sp.]|uniref:hypothetical protein n=1 Tax=Rhodoferax sp. TaxID=50421 RepID=UPI0025FEF95F
MKSGSPGLPRFARNDDTGRASFNGMDAPVSNRHRCAKVWGVSNNPRQREGASTMKVTTIGLDLAKDVFQIC